jgi:DNA glycosylase AlkZ-like
MGAMQAQDYPMAKWAVGVRLPGSTDQALEAAVSKADILRTHLLRPTWHFVAAEDIYWLLDLTAAQVKIAQSSRDRVLELTEQVYTKSNTIIEKALSNGNQLTRQELIARLNEAGIATQQNRASHLFARAELEKIICNGATRNGKITYALLSERVHKVRRLSREEALTELARRYFTSRCPASLQDFIWWSGLPAKVARYALEQVKSVFSPETIDGSTYWFPADFIFPSLFPTSVFLLPTYDEFILSYTDRRASIPPGLNQYMKVISDRGVFRPLFLVNGQVAGIWKRTIEKDSILVEIQPFSPLDPSIVGLIDLASTHYEFFSGKKIMIRLLSGNYYA